MTNQRGFTLIEMAIVLAVVGLLVGGGLIAIGPVLDQTHSTQTKNNLDQIENALVLFAIRNNRLPCPADGSLAYGSVGYGVEGAQVVATASSPAVCNTTKVPLTNSVIPWITLGIDESYSLDGWNNRIAYFPAGGQTGTGWDSLVDAGTTGSGAAATATVSAGAVTLSAPTSGGQNYSTTLLPSILVNGGGTGVIPPIFTPTSTGAITAFTFVGTTGCSSSSTNCGYSTVPTVVIGTAGCLYRNGGNSVNGRWSLCDSYLSSGTSTVSYLSPSYPYGNYISVYSIIAAACSNELTDPNYTTVTTAGTCTAAPVGTNASTNALLNVPSYGNRAAYVLISHGKSGIFGWNRSGHQIADNGATPHALKVYNSATSVATLAGTAGATPNPDNYGFVQGTPTGGTITSANFFDDIVRWRSPAMIIQLCGSGACGNP